MARTVPTLRLRLHVLCWQHLQLCRELFAKPLFVPQRRLVRAQRKTQLAPKELQKEIRRLLNVKQVTADRVAAEGFKGPFAKLGVLDLERWYFSLIGEL